MELGLATALDQIHDQGIGLFLAGAPERPYCSLELLFRDAKRRAGQDASSSSESMDDDDEGGGPAQGGSGRRFTRLAPGSVTFVSRSTGQPWKTARPLTRMGESVRGTADPRGAHRPSTSKSEAAPKRGSGGGRGAGAGGAAGVVAGVIAVSMVPRSGGPSPRTPSALTLPRQLPHSFLLGPLQGAAGMPELAGALCFAKVIAYTWATTRLVRNRLLHILPGNGPSSVVYILRLALVAPVFWDVHKGSRIIVDEAMTTAAAAASAVIEEAGRPGRGLRPGSGLAVGLLFCPLALGQEASQPPCPYVSWKHGAGPACGQRSYL